MAKKEEVQPQPQVQAAPKAPETKIADAGKQVEALSEVAAGMAKDGDNIVSLLNNIVYMALQQGASDIHIEPMEEKVMVRFRIDGILREVVQIDKRQEQSLVFIIKVTAKLRTDEHYAPQDGRIRFLFKGKKLDTRISILATTKGEKIVMRLLTQEGRSYDLNSLGLIDNDLKLVEKAYMKPYGMILATGPTGSGKTTTLYSILKQLNTREKNITTIEDPVEYEIDGVNHIQVNVKAGLTFGKGLRAIVRQDPNIIMVGEIRDTETARIAVNSAMTGHLVLSTVHTNDAVSTIPRLMDMGVEPYLVAASVNLIVAQRLARKLCDKCKQQFTLTKEQFEEIKSYRADISNLIKVGSKYYQEKGCTECGNTGFKGRIGLYEVFDVNEEIRRIITTSKNVDDIFQIARKNGLIVMVEDGVKKVESGLTTISQLMKVTALKE